MNHQTAPDSTKKKIRLSEIGSMRAQIKHGGTHTVCEQARCPNIAECFAKPTATFLIMGDTCTRACTFCATRTGAPQPPLDESVGIIEIARRNKLRHIVITSVTRDDLPDEGASVFAALCGRIREELPGVSIEILTPDFVRTRERAVALLADAPFEIFNHNLETVPSLYGSVRRGADYDWSLDLLAAVKVAKPGVFTKTGVMVGLGETIDELAGLIADAAAHRVDILTIGQYLKPAHGNAEVVKYYDEEGFAGLADIARKEGIEHVYASRFTRSSYNSEEVFRSIVSR